MCRSKSETSNNQRIKSFYAGLGDQRPWVRIPPSRLADYQRTTSDSKALYPLSGFKSLAVSCTFLQGFAVFVSQMCRSF